MLKSSSIVARILWLHVIVVGGASILMPLMLYLLLGAEANRLHGRAMHEQADRITHHLVIADGRWRLDLPEPMQDLYSEAYGRYTYAVVDGAGTVLFTSRGDGEAVFPNDPRGSAPRALETRRAGELVAGTSNPLTADGNSVWVQVAENMAHRDALMDDVVANFFPAVAWITLPILLAMLVLDAVIVRRSLRPVLLASNQAKEIGPRRTGVRLSGSAIPTEVRPLVEAVNQALDRLEQGLKVQREFSANAAHELRTPLTILRTRIDTLPDKETSKLLRDDVEAMTRTVGQLLDLAELETMTVDPAARVDLRAICAEVIAFLAPLALDQGKDIALGGSEQPLWIAGDAGMIARAIRNLVENAIRYGPVGSAIQVDLDGDGTIHVRDEGPGIGDSDREHLFQRFWRKHRAASGSAGLGLAIVRQIVDAHGGTIAVINRPTGGAQFSVNFGSPITG